MERSVTWTLQALADLDEIEDFIKQDSPFYAQAVVSRLLDIASSLVEQPLMGRVVPEFESKQVRERIVYSYRVVYRLSERIVEVIAVIHGRRQMTPLARRLEP